MKKMPPPNLVNAMREVAAVMTDDGGSFTITMPNICDHCEDDTKEAFPYNVYDQKGTLWKDLCNDCFETLGCIIEEDPTMFCVDPFDEANWNKPLWCVYGPDCFPSVLLCKLSDKAGPQYSPSIWGYSIYKGVAGFRTLGRYLETWMEEDANEGAVFWDEKRYALAHLDAILEPRTES